MLGRLVTGPTVRKGGSHFWCHRQDRIALSSADAELKSVCEGMTELLHLKNVITFLRGVCPSLVSSTDASACRGIILRHGAGPVKHLRILQLWVREAVVDNKIDVQKMRRDDNLANFLCSPGKEKLHAGRIADFGWSVRPLEIV